jgi:co-chaperonin GroES (HSP10)
MPNIEFVPLSDYIVVERAMTKGSAIQMPDNAEPVSDDIFVVVKAGPGDDSNPQKVKVGDKVCLTGYINMFSYKGAKCILGRGRDVVAIVKEE